MGARQAVRPSEAEAKRIPVTIRAEILLIFNGFDSKLWAHGDALGCKYLVEV
jgi:hypothetical protein